MEYIETFVAFYRLLVLLLLYSVCHYLKLRAACCHISMGNNNSFLVHVYSKQTVQLHLISHYLFVLILFFLITTIRGREEKK